jgi:hypothetical protein
MGLSARLVEPLPFCDALMPEMDTSVTIGKTLRRLSHGAKLLQGSADWGKQRSLTLGAVRATISLQDVLYGRIITR